MSANTIEDEGAALLAESLTLTETLKELIIKSCEITTDGIQMICEAISDRDEDENPLIKLDVTNNILNVEAEIALNDLLMKSAKLKIIWKEAGGGSASSEDKKWKQIEIDEIVEHYGASDILNNLLDGNSLLPLIDDHSILSSLDIDDEDVYFNFFNNIFASKESISQGLEMILCILRNGLPPNDADDEFNDLDESELYLNETDQELDEYTPLVRILIEQMEILIQLLTNDSLVRLFLYFLPLFLFFPSLFPSLSIYLSLSSLSFPLFLPYPLPLSPFIIPSLLKKKKQLKLKC